MRALVGLLVLLTLFASAAAWQGRLTSDQRRRQDHQRGVPSISVAARESGQTLQAGWNTLIVGRPSGSQPFFDNVADALPDQPRPGNRLERDALPQETERAPAPRPEPQPVPHFGPDFEIVVRPGDVLSKICQGHYRTRPDGIGLHQIVEAVGRYNGLASADALRAEFVLRLPDVDRFTNPD
ncbi:MAG: hypothetical protein ACI80N_002347 [Gammaproteobacteria bacterium]|jgi:hypothetical protein